MLAAEKSVLVAEVREQAVNLRNAELSMYIDRFSNVIGIASISAGFAFASIVELEIPAVDERHEYSTAFIHMFWITSSVALNAGIFCTVVATYAIVYGHRLALQGGSKHAVDVAVGVLAKSFPPVMLAGALGLLCILLASLAITWVKMDPTTSVIAANSIIFFLGLGATAGYVGWMMVALSSRRLVHGDVHVQAGERSVDLEDISAPTHNEDRAAAATDHSVRDVGGGRPTVVAEPSEAQVQALEAKSDSRPWWQQALGPRS